MGIFQEKQSSPIELALVIRIHIQYWSKTNNTSKRSVTGKQNKIELWKKPDSRKHKINFDATWVFKDNPSDFAVIIRDDACDFERGKHDHHQINSRISRSARVPSSSTLFQGEGIQ